MVWNQSRTVFQAQAAGFHWTECFRMLGCVGFSRLSTQHQLTLEHLLMVTDSQGHFEHLKNLSYKCGKSDLTLSGDCVQVSSIGAELSQPVNSSCI